MHKIVTVKTRLVTIAFNEMDHLNVNSLLFERKLLTKNLWCRSKASQYMNVVNDKKNNNKMLLEDMLKDETTFHNISLVEFERIYRHHK